jgi:hypothetical protein
MAQPTDLTGMLTAGLFEPTQQALPSSLEQVSMRLAQQAGTGLRRGIGAMTGADTRTNPEMAAVAMRGLDIADPEDQPKILQIVRKYSPEKEAQVTAAMSKSNRERALTDQTMALKERQVAADELRATTSGRSTSPFQFGASKTYKDSKGNYYLGTQKRTVGTGEVETVLSPVAGAPAKPQGDVEEVGAYGQTATEMIEGKVKVGAEKTEAELFEKRKDTAATDFSLSSKNVLDADRMLRALDNITTGGFVPETAKLATDFLGKTPADVGEFEILAKEQMIAKLSAFGANPTEGEARRAAELVPAIRKSEGLNRRLIQSFREEMKRRRDNSAYLLGPDASVKGYREFSLGQYEGVGEEGKIINFGDLK